MTKPSALKIDVKAGILSTVANSVYSSTSMKIREAISNSLDNHADKCILFFGNKDVKGQQVPYLSLFDNGNGISEGRFREVLTSIGYGLSRADENAYSHFGLGLMSIFKLGKKVTIITKPKGLKGLVQLVVESSTLFSEETEGKSLSLIEKLFKLTSGHNINIRDSLSILSKKTLSKHIGNYNSFTEIIIEGVYEEDIEEILTPQFENNLRKYIPLEPNPDDQFFKNLVPADKNKIFDLYSNKSLFPTVEYFFGVGRETDIKPLVSG